jgi:APA family basic amino acid/polyamine antiporter
MANQTKRSGLFATKPIDVLVEETHEKETELKRAVGALDLTALGLGAIIGTGIFVIIGEAITTSGPSIVTCVFSALAFAELASAIPVSGSASRTPTRRSGSSPPGSSAGT